MATMIVLPRLGNLLRSVITDAGFRAFIAAKGRDKDLDDLAAEARPGSLFDLLTAIEDVCRRELAMQCGMEWSNLLSEIWLRTRTALQQFALHVDSSPLPDDLAATAIERHFTTPMLAGFVNLMGTMMPGPEIYNWIGNPFAAWVRYASRLAGLGQQELLDNLANHLEIDDRTLQRWIKGEPIAKLRWPHRPAVEAAIGEAGAKAAGVSQIDRMTGWLVITVAFQALPSGRRDAIRNQFKHLRVAAWSLGEAISVLNRQGEPFGATALRDAAIPLLYQIQESFAAKPRKLDEIALDLDALQELIDGEPTLRRQYQHIHDWFAARLAAISERQADAIALYKAAVEGVWWYGGQNQHPILDEALRYAVGTGHKVVADHIWDLTFLLGLNQGAKRPLDEQEQRRIAFGFEEMFHPLLAKARVPPPMEIVVREAPFSLSSKDIGNPNRKVKHAEGRTRRTPLMVAIQEGTPEDVKRLLKAGGNPDDYITESGEGPLSYALRRACDRKDLAILDHLLTIDLLPETVNRPASTKREMPLKIAIEMANAAAVDRLIELGADVEAPCCYSPSTLCYAMLVLHMSLHPQDRTQERMYFAGKGPPENYDAKEGAVLSADLGARRMALFGAIHSSSVGRAIWDGVKAFYTRPAADCRAVVRTLLKHRADANRRYKVEPHHLVEWTPTLFAAEVGDLEIFQALVEGGGDPRLTLLESSALERFDALWVAVNHKRDSIVHYLMEHYGQAS